MEESGEAWSSVGHECNVLRSFLNDVYAAGSVALQESTCPCYARCKLLFAQDRCIEPLTSCLQPIMFLPDEFISLAFDVVKCTQSAGLRLYLRMGRIGLLMLACVVMLIVEYRLKVTAVKSSLWTMLSLGATRALRRIALQYDPDNFPRRREETYCFLAAGGIIGAAWTLTTDPKSRAFADLEYLPITEALVNLASTTTALLLGRSIILPFDESILETDADHGHIAHQRSHDGTILMVVSTVANLTLALSFHRSYTSWLQYCCFVIALLCGTSGPWRASNGWEGHGGTTAYELIENEVAEDAPRNNEQRGTGTTTSSKCSWSMAGLLLVSLLWTGSVVFNLCTPAPGRLPARIDRVYEPPSPMEIVLSMYKEPIQEVRDLLIGLKSAHETGKASVTIYTKDEESDPDDIKLKTGADSVVKLPNVGREGETYLHHIISRWDSLAKHTMYIQADIHFSKNFYRQLKNFFVPESTGFLNLGFFETCNCEHCGDEFWWWDYATIIPEYYAKVYNSTCEEVLLSYKGSFLVSAARTRGLGKEFYQDLRQALVDKGSWAHQPEYLDGRPDSMSEPDVGYTLERMWNLIFQCAEMDIAWKCPSYMSGWRLGGDISDCQCFDKD